MKIRTRSGVVGFLLQREVRVEIVEPVGIGRSEQAYGLSCSSPTGRPDPGDLCASDPGLSESGRELDDRLGEIDRRDRNLVENHSDSRTQRTLLERLAQSGGQNQAAWSEFVDRYGRKIYRWCLRWRLQDADAQDVTQIVLLKLAQRMRVFTYDPGRSFRAWLKTVTHHAWQDYVDSRQTAMLATGGEPAEAALDSVTARNDLSSELEHAFDLELLETAMQRIRLRAATHTWMAFSMTAVEGIPALEVAQRLGMKIARVYAARSTIQQRLQDECRRLEAAQEAW
jgi:RNA polymerase sigma factor (sigma-70 family)